MTINYQLRLLQMVRNGRMTLGNASEELTKELREDPNVDNSCLKTR